MSDLYNELQDNIKKLEISLSLLRQSGREYAQCERDYRVALSQLITLERSKGTPVTIISDVCRGNERIAALKMERDIKDSLYKSSMEAINVYKIKIKILEGQMQREWGGKNE